MTQLPAGIDSELLKTHFLVKADSNMGALFASGEIELKEGSVIWGTDSYAGHQHKPSQAIPNSPTGVGLIIPRVEKNKQEQKKRTKDKAEVFTPTWVTTLQNSLVDDHILGRKAFGEFDPENMKKWIPSKKPIFAKKDLERAFEYIASPRLEITAGEAPYLIHRYETTTGEMIPVKDSEKRFARSGLLDRKLRVVSEIATKDEWTEMALVALNSIYGYEWQGDSLYIARKNFVLDFIEFYEDFFGIRPSDELIFEVADIASWQLWQMDGLKMVTPESCSDDCDACTRKLKRGHNGQMPALRWGDKIVTFEDFLPDLKPKTNKK